MTDTTPTQTTITLPADVVRRVMIGGNHLGLLIGADHPSHKMSTETALAHYSQKWGGQNQYEAWCCWKTIMEMRDVIEA